MTMIEKIAKAIIAAEAGGKHAMARAALTAMLEPSKAMRDVNSHIEWGIDQHGFQDIIHAALNEGMDPGPGVDEWEDGV